jgi:hypothetical protein
LAGVETPHPFHSRWVTANEMISRRWIETFLRQTFFYTYLETTDCGLRGVELEKHLKLSTRSNVPLECQFLSSFPSFPFLRSNSSHKLGAALWSRNSSNREIARINLLSINVQSVIDSTEVTAIHTSFNTSTD